MANRRTKVEEINVGGPSDSAAAPFQIKIEPPAGFHATGRMVCRRGAGQGGRSSVDHTLMANRRGHDGRICKLVLASLCRPMISESCATPRSEIARFSASLKAEILMIRHSENTA